MVYISYKFAIFRYLYYYYWPQGQRSILTQVPSADTFSVICHSPVPRSEFMHASGCFYNGGNGKNTIIVTEISSDVDVFGLPAFPNVSMCTSFTIILARNGSRKTRPLRHDGGGGPLGSYHLLLNNRGGGLFNRCGCRPYVKKSISRHVVTARNIIPRIGVW